MVKGNFYQCGAIHNIYVYIYPQDAWFAVALDASIMFSGGGGGVGWGAGVGGCWVGGV